MNLGDLISGHEEDLGKGELLAGGIGGATKIVHKGDWFARVKATLGKSRDMR